MAAKSMAQNKHIDVSISRFPSQVEEVGDLDFNIFQYQIKLAALVAGIQSELPGFFVEPFHALRGITDLIQVVNAGIRAIAPLAAGLRGQTVDVITGATRIAAAPAPVPTVRVAAVGRIRFLVRDPSSSSIGAAAADCRRNERQSLAANKGLPG